MEAAPCTLGAHLCCIFGDYHERNNSQGGKLGINFDGNRSLWLVMELIPGDKLCLSRGALFPGVDPKECGFPAWTCRPEVVVVFGYLAV